MTAILVSLAAFVCTLLGGLFALRFKDRLHLILGFSAGAVIGVAFFDLMPEAIDLGSSAYTVPTVTSIVALGFVIYLVIDRIFVMHGHQEDCLDHHLHRGRLGAGSLSIHSFLDGAAIGLAFQVSAAVGAIVTAAVLTHDFSDGINTVNLVVKNKGERKDALRWLIVDAVAPGLGVLSTRFFTLPQSALCIVLALFSGFFLYIGASDLLPESHHDHPTKWTTVMTILGMGILFIAVRIAG